MNSQGVIDLAMRWLCPESDTSDRQALSELLDRLDLVEQVYGWSAELAACREQARMRLSEGNLRDSPTRD